MLALLIPSRFAISVGPMPSTRRRRISGVFASCCRSSPLVLPFGLSFGNSFGLPFERQLSFKLGDCLSGKLKRSLTRLTRPTVELETRGPVPPHSHRLRALAPKPHPLAAWWAGQAAGVSGPTRRPRPFNRSPSLPAQTTPVSHRHLFLESKFVRTSESPGGVAALGAICVQLESK